MLFLAGGGPSRLSVQTGALLLPQDPVLRFCTELGWVPSWQAGTNGNARHSPSHGATAPPWALLPGAPHRWARAARLEGLPASAAPAHPNHALVSAPKCVCGGGN